MSKNNEAEQNNLDDVESINKQEEPIKLHDNLTQEELEKLPPFTRNFFVVARSLKTIRLTVQRIEARVETNRDYLFRILIVLAILVPFSITLQMFIYLSSSFYSFFVYQAVLLNIPHPYLIGAIELPIAFLFGWFVVAVVLLFFCKLIIEFHEPKKDDQKSV